MMHDFVHRATNRLATVACARRLACASVGLLALAVIVSGCGSACLSGAKLGQRNQDWDRAITNAQCAVQEDPGNVEAYYILANAYAEKDEHAEAKKYFDKVEEVGGNEQILMLAARLEQNYTNVNFNNGQTMREAGNLDGALNAYETALIYNPELTNAWVNVGLVHIDLSKPSIERASAIEAEAIAAEEAGDAARAAELSDQARAIRSEGYAQVESGLDAFLRALETDPENPQAQRNVAGTIQNQGNLAFEEKRWEDAIDWYERSLEYLSGDPREDSRLLLQVGNAYFNLDELTKAAGYYERAAELADQIPDPAEKKQLLEFVLRNHYLALLKARDWAGAEPVLRRAVQVNPNDANLFNYLGAVLTQLGRNEEALQMYERAKELSG
jgi:tetratricopeptide (TPR) repeat protein